MKFRMPLAENTIIKMAAATQRDRERNITTSPNIGSKNSQKNDNDIISTMRSSNRGTTACTRVRPSIANVASVMNEHLQTF